MKKKWGFLLQYFVKKNIWNFKLKLPKLAKIHANSFPAFHLKPEKADLALFFSTEAMVVALGIFVAIFNFFTFVSGTPKDQSQAAKLLSYHSQLNPKLYSQNASVIKTVTREAGFFSYAQAENFAALSNDSLTFSEERGSEIYEQLQNPSVETSRSLLEKQIKIYQTQEGDSLNSIAEKFGINKQTILWANGLSSNTIKPGWFLRILPTNGVLHQATSNDTLPDLAKKYKAELDRIIAYNGLASAEDIDAGYLIIIPDGVMPEPPKPKTTPIPRKSNDGKVDAKGVYQPRVVDNGTGHIFPWGYCTWYVATKTHVPWGGNAKNWLANARAYGAIISSEPVVGSIVVTTDNSRYGHVAFVESLGPGGFTVSEMNYKKFGQVNTRFIPYGSKIIRGFILP